MPRRRVLTVLVPVLALAAASVLLPSMSDQLFPGR